MTIPKEKAISQGYSFFLFIQLIISLITDEVCIKLLVTRLIGQPDFAFEGLNTRISQRVQLITKITIHQYFGIFSIHFSKKYDKSESIERVLKIHSSKFLKKVALYEVITL